MTDLTLAGLGWSDHFANQIDDADAGLRPARINEVQRDRLRAFSPEGPLLLIPAESTGSYAVGDWVLTDGETARRRLTPRTDLTRRAAGHSADSQRIAANVDTIAIVTSCNRDFNEARLERYLALVTASGALPLVLLTKADQTDEPHEFRRRAEALSPLVTALPINAKDHEAVQQLVPWCGPGLTLALVGSSGVGKTTLRNALSDLEGETQDVREVDARGRHTTTFRALLPTRAGGWLIDTPGMRELQLTDASEGIAAVFDDIEELVQSCRFRDCAHETEPGCAVQAALRDGTLDPTRLARWRKLEAEDRHNSATLAESRAKSRAFGKMIKGAQAKGRRKRDPGR